MPVDRGLVKLAWFVGAIFLSIFIVAGIGGLMSLVPKPPLPPPSCMAEQYQRSMEIVFQKYGDMTPYELTVALGEPNGINLQPIPGYNMSTNYWVYKYSDKSKLAISMLPSSNGRLYHLHADFVKPGEEVIGPGIFDEFYAP